MAGTVIDALRRFNPLRCSGTELPPNVLLMAKVVTIGLALKGYVAALPPVFLPLVPQLEVFDPSAFQRALQIGFWIAAFFLLLNVRVRLCALLLGSILLLASIASIPTYRNAIVYSGCILFLAGLSDASERPWLLRAQVSLLYLGAGWNKLLDADWRSGQYFENWMIGVLTNPYYEAAASLLPGRSLSFSLSWLTIVLEIFVGFALWRRKSAPVAIAAAGAFHVSALLLTHQDFGIFFTAVCASFLAFAEWPSSVTVSHDPARLSGRVLHRGLRLADVDQRISWIVRGGPLTLLLNGRASYGGEALKRLLLMMPAAMMAIGLLLCGPKWVKWVTAASLLLLVPLRFPEEESTS